jgi:hypothetical protein
MTRSTAVLWLRPILAAGVLVLSIVGATNVATASEVTFVLPIANGRLPENMRLIRVKQNDVVKLEWSTDKPMSIHLHGYDIETAVAPGAVSEMTFTARAAGRFTVEPHLAQGPAGGHAHGDILVTIEVYP